MGLHRLVLKAAVGACTALGCIIPRSAFHQFCERVYIQFPAGIAQGELPPLFVIGPQGDGQLVNYRFRSPYYVVDRLFGAAELRLGADKAAVVRIERTDGVANVARRH